MKLILILGLILILSLKSNVFVKEHYIEEKELIIVSLSTSPKRISKTEGILKRMLEQTLVPDKIVLNLPYVFKRNNTTFVDPLPEFITKNEKIRVNFTEDIGPITKVLPTTKLYTDPNTIIISIDDDIWYPIDMIEKLVRIAKKYPHAVVTGSNANVGRKVVDGVTYEELAEGFKGILYRQKHLSDFPIHEISNFPRPCFLGDDLILSNYLKGKKIPIISVPIEVIPLEYGEQEDALHKSHNNPNFFGHDYNGCVEYLKEKGNYYLEHF